MDFNYEGFQNESLLPLFSHSFNFFFPAAAVSMPLKHHLDKTWTFADCCVSFIAIINCVKSDALLKRRNVGHTLLQTSSVRDALVVQRERETLTAHGLN